MNGFLLYAPQRRWRACLAFACAAAIHATAVGLAKNQAPPVAVGDIRRDGEIIIEDSEPPLPPQQEDTMPPPISPAAEEQTFAEDNATPLPIRNRRAARPIAHPPASGLPRFGSVRAMVLYGPRPDYPYVARRDRITGSGVALAIINPATGSVLDVRMAQSTGSLILDSSTVSTLRRWRFRSGTLPRVEVPITYTLSGASY
jgi:TonB family protein